MSCPEVEYAVKRLKEEFKKDYAVYSSGRLDGTGFKDYVGGRVVATENALMFLGLSKDEIASLINEVNSEEEVRVNG